MKHLVVPLLLISLTVGCTSMSRRDARIVENIEIQNKLINVIKYDRSSAEFKQILKENINLQIKESELISGLETIKKANEVSIKKLKPIVEGACHCGKSKRVCNAKKSKY